MLAAEDYLLRLKANEEEDGGALYPDEEGLEVISQMIEDALQVQYSLYEQLARQSETLQFENDELDIKLEQT